MTQVKSSNIKAIGYNPTTRTLTIEFNSGSTYDYHDIGQEEHDALIGAESIGSHFHKHVRPKKFTKHEIKT